MEVKVTGVPLQMVVGLTVLIVMLAVMAPETVMTRWLEVAGLPVAHVALEVNSTHTES